MAVGRFVPKNATVRITTTNQGSPFPSTDTATRLDTHSLTVTSANANAGTVYLFMNATTPAGRGVQSREKSMLPLTKGQSFTFTGIPIGNSGYRTFSFGTGISYVLGSATSQRLILTWMAPSDAA